MRTKPIFVIALLATIVFGACSGIQPITAPTNIPPAATSEAEATGSMADMDHGKMNAKAPFDAMFIDSMIHHHQGAIDMANVALEQAEHDEIRTMAQQIIDSQQAEIRQMQDWRTAWYPEVEETAGLEMSMGQMTISDDTNKPFDQRLIEAMIPHHQGAIDMANMALSSAEHQEIRTLAQQVIDAQLAEIKQMQGWLSEWYGVSQ